jgi:hypothetical protein
MGLKNVDMLFANRCFTSALIMVCLCQTFCSFSSTSNILSGLVGMGGGRNLLLTGPRAASFPAMKQPLEGPAGSEVNFKTVAETYVALRTMLRTFRKCSEHCKRSHSCSAPNIASCGTWYQVTVSRYQLPQSDLSKHSQSWSQKARIQTQKCLRSETQGPAPGTQDPDPETSSRL